VRYELTLNVHVQIVPVPHIRCAKHPPRFLIESRHGAFKKVSLPGQDNAETTCPRPNAEFRHEIATSDRETFKMSGLNNTTTSDTSSNPSMADQLEFLANRLLAQVKDFRETQKPGERNFKERVRIISWAHAIVGAARLPDEQWMSPALSLSRFTATRMFIEWKAFENIPDQGAISYAAWLQRLGLMRLSSVFC
jgi:hypothetical protein